MIRISIFAYSGNADETLECVRCARMFIPAAIISVVDDASSPMDRNMATEIIAEGTQYRQSNFHRSGNLCGKDAVIGVLGEMLSGAEDGDILVKIDPDTVVLSSSILQSFDDPKTVYLACGDTRQLAYGSCYAIRAYAAQKIKPFVESAFLPVTAGEDLVIHHFARQVFEEERLAIIPPWSQEYQDSRWTAFNWMSQDVTPGAYAKHFDLVTVGSFRPKDHPISTVECMRRMRFSADKICKI